MMFFENEFLSKWFYVENAGRISNFLSENESQRFINIFHVFLVIFMENLKSSDNELKLSLCDLFLWILLFLVRGIRETWFLLLHKNLPRLLRPQFCLGMGEIALFTPFADPERREFANDGFSEISFGETEWVCWVLKWVPFAWDDGEGLWISLKSELSYIVELSEIFKSVCIKTSFSHVAVAVVYWKSWRFFKRNLLCFQCRHILVL